MKKNGKLYTIMLRNQYGNSLLNYENKTKYYDKTQYENISTTSNIINQYKKFKQSNLFNSDAKLSKTTAIYTKNILDKDKKSYTKLYKRKINHNFFVQNRNKFHSNEIDISNNNNTMDDKTENKNNFFNDDSGHSSMETIKKILYNTDTKDSKEETNDKNNNENNLDNEQKIFRSVKLNDTPDMGEEKIFFVNKNSEIKNKSNERSNSPLFKNNNFFKKQNIGSKIIKKKLFNKINFNDNKNLTYHNRFTKYGKFNSMNLNTNNNSNNYNYDYDYEFFDNKYNTINDDFNKIIEEKDISTYNDNVIKNKNNNYSVKKINNNINININNNNNNKIDNQINNINYTSRFQNIDNESSLFGSKEKNSFNEYLYMKQKIKELTEEINNKNLLINEYSTLAKHSKMKFEQLIEHNKKKIEEMEQEHKKQINDLNLKINNLEKEKQEQLNKDKENQKYISFLEMLLFDDNNDNNNKNDDKINKNEGKNDGGDGNEEKNKNNDGGETVEEKDINKKFEEILQIKVNEIKKLKKDLEDKIDENEKMKSIIIKFKNSKSLRAVSNPRKHIVEIEGRINKQLERNINKNDIKSIPSINLNKNTKINNNIFHSLNEKTKNE